MIFEVFTLGYFQANCYIVGDEKTKECAIIDPGGTPDKVLKRCEELGLCVKYILLTHGHGDHIAGVEKIKEKTDAKVLMSKEDEYLVNGGTQELLPIFRNIKPFIPDEFISEKDKVKIGSIEVEVIETPGHTPGSLTFKIGDILITGDTLFQGSIGRTDFPKGSYDDIINSIKNKLLIFEDNVKVFPGHGPSTTIGKEKRFNPFLNE
ncbi:Glyoxylase, beta-lactamase superfamily II [Caloramator fervidus]|uniref:Glyoxylase, beta-lactamase superfamily II n=1 Tax=Caloramator fervidus TaxID=29344 RepID=A0A1H5W016_9CLOT|nr:MBL fold metallo-hydrolase [Caloramator fervidus]SEF92461.1 Glyoxylase, beta-lactamase superfamily II [Caloramator fervidus]